MNEKINLELSSYDYSMLVLSLTEVALASHSSPQAVDWAREMIGQLAELAKAKLKNLEG